MQRLTQNRKQWFFDCIFRMPERIEHLKTSTDVIDCVRIIDCRCIIGRTKNVRDSSRLTRFCISNLPIRHIICFCYQNTATQLYRSLRKMLCGFQQYRIKSTDDWFWPKFAFHVKYCPRILSSGRMIRRLFDMLIGAFQPLIRRFCFTWIRWTICSSYWLAAGIKIEPFWGKKGSNLAKYDPCKI